MSLHLQIPVFPPFTVLLVLAVGVLLVLRWPYYGFLFAVLLPIAVPIRTMTFTRLPILWVFFNLYDTALLIGLIAAFLDSRALGFRIRMRKVALAILAMLAIGAIVTTAECGWTYYTLRALRCGIAIPLYFIIADNVVCTAQRRQALFKGLVLAMVAAELQHVVLLRTTAQNLAGDDPSSLRTAAFIMTHGEIWLLVGFYTVFGRVKQPLLQLAIGMLLLVNLISTQQRSIAFAFIVALPVLHVWFIRRQSTERLQPYVIGTVAIVLVTIAIVPALQLDSAVENYIARISDTLSWVDNGPAEEDRMTAGRIEVRDFLRSNILFGVGLDYFQVYGTDSDDVDRPRGFGHLGYVTYLSQLGVAGFLVYAVWFPFFVLKRSRWLCNRCNLEPATRHLVLLTGGLFIFCVIQFTMTNSFLAPDICTGVLAGFTANLYDQMRVHEVPRCGAIGKIQP